MIITKTKPILIRTALTKSKLLGAQLAGNNRFGRLFDIDEFQQIYGPAISMDDNNHILIGIITNIKEPVLKVHVNLYLSFPSENRRSKYQHTLTGNSFYGKRVCAFDDFIDPINKYFINDYLIIELEGAVTVEYDGPPEQKEEQNGMKLQMEKSCGLGLALWDEADKDFAIDVDGKVIQIHKCVIRTKSPVFVKMFQAGMKESKESKVTIIDFEYDIVELAMKYFYGIQIIDLLDVNIAIELLRFADKYDTAELRDSMEEYLFIQKTPMNIVEIVNASILTNGILLRENSFDYLVECMEKKIAIKDLGILDDFFALRLLKASFSTR